MDEETKRMLDEAIVLMRHGADRLETESYHVLPVAMRKWADEADAILAKENGQ